MDRARLAAGRTKTPGLSELRRRRIDEFALGNGLELPLERCEFFPDRFDPLLVLGGSKRLLDGAAIGLQGVQGGQGCLVAQLAMIDPVDEIGLPPAFARLDAVLRGNRRRLREIRRIGRAAHFDLGEGEHVVLRSFRQLRGGEPHETKGMPLRPDRNGGGARIGLIAIRRVAQHRHAGLELRIIRALDPVAQGKAEACSDPPEIIIGGTKPDLRDGDGFAQIELHPFLFVGFVHDLAVKAVLRTQVRRAVFLL